jgi:DNA-binding NarL/FixJ family response regulator
MIKVTIVDDHQLFRKSLVLLINSFKGVQVISDSENGKVFLEKLYKTDALPHIVLLDIEMPEMDGFETCIILRRDFPQIKILIVSQLTTKESIHKILELGAHGYFTKNSDPNQLQHAIRSLQDTGYYFGMELGSVIREALLWQNRSNINVEEEEELFVTPVNKDALTNREVEIIKMACMEFSAAEIAEKMCITSKTVESHKKRILDKTSTKNFIGAIMYAFKHDYLSLTDINQD